MQHLVLYDGTCGVCDHAVQWVLRHDAQEIFAFAPLQGTTAAELLAQLKQVSFETLCEQTTRNFYQLFNKVS